MAKERLTDLNASVMDIIITMSGGNPGALTACMELMRKGHLVDPDDIFQGLGSIMTLDTMNIWDSRLYMLWSDVCGRDIGKMIDVLRAYQLGQLAGATEAVINYAIDNRGKGLDLDAVVAAVQQRLPNFKVNGAVEVAS